LICSDENERLKEENEELKEKLGRLQKKLSAVEVEVDNLSRKRMDPTEIYREVLTLLLDTDFSERAVSELLRLNPEKRRAFLKELLKFSLRKGNERVEPLSTLRDVYKLKLSGGRVYLRRAGERWEVVGLLDSEDDKEKERYIRNVLSRLYS